MATPSPVSSRSDPGPLVVGLTGGIGSGKTTISNGLLAHGAAIVDTDLIAHALTAPGGAAMAAIEREFGADYVASDGALDRPRMRKLAFETPAARRRLEAILHPMIRAATQAEQARAAPIAPYVVLVIPLLIESGRWEERVHRVLVVDCSVATQVERVERRSNLAPVQVRNIIAQQATRAARLAAADDVIVNEGGISTLPARIARLHDLYSSLAAAKRHQPL